MPTSVFTVANVPVKLGADVFAFNPNATLPETSPVSVKVLSLSNAQALVAVPDKLPVKPPPPIEPPPLIIIC